MNTSEKIECLALQWLVAKEREASAIKIRKEIESELKELARDEITPQLDANYGTGSALISTGTHVIKLNYPKKVTWDQDKLADIWERIDASEEFPEDYIERKLTVTESKYKNMPTFVQQQFQSARTVKAGNPTFTIIENKE